MSIVDLNKRIGSNIEEFQNHWKSPDSKIYVNPISNSTNPSSFDLEIGDSYILPGSNQKFLISKEDGIKVNPKQTIVFFTNQQIKLPLNVFGLVTGKGTFIYKGCFISSGKIDPGFDGKLKIGFYNGSNSSIKLNIGDKFATVFFLNTEITLTSVLDQYSNELNPDLKEITWYQKALMYIKDHWISFLAWFLVAIPAALYYSFEFLKSIGLWSSQK